MEEKTEEEVIREETEIHYVITKVNQISKDIEEIKNAITRK